MTVPQFLYYVAFGNNAFDDPNAILAPPSFTPPAGQPATVVAESFIVTSSGYQLSSPSTAAAVAVAANDIYTVSAVIYAQQTAGGGPYPSIQLIDQAGNQLIDVPQPAQNAYNSIGSIAAPVVSADYTVGATVTAVRPRFNMNSAALLGWTVFTRPTLTKTGAQILGTGSASGTVTAGYQFDARPGQVVTISGQIDASHVTTGSPLLQVLDQSGAVIAGSTVSQTAGVSGSVSVTFTVPSGVSAIKPVYSSNNCTIASGQFLKFSSLACTVGGVKSPFLSALNLVVDPHMGSSSVWGPWIGQAPYALVSWIQSTPVGGGYWTDISRFVSGHTISRGRQHELGQFEAGICQLDLGNSDGRFNPWNTSGPYYGDLLPMKPLRVVDVTGGTSSTRFTGLTNAWDVLWDDPVSQMAHVHATDAFRSFQMADVTSTNYSSTVAGDSPSGYWRLNDPAGSTSFADYYAPLGVTGTLTPGSGTAVLGSAGLLLADDATSLQLTEGTASSYSTATVAATATSAPNTSSGGITVEFWVKLGSTTASFPWSVYVPFTNSYTSTAQGITIAGPTGSSTTWQFGGFGLANVVNLTSVALNDGNAHHVVVEVNNSGAVSLFVDGVAAGSVTGTFTSGGGNATIEVGDSTGAGSIYFQEFAFYNSLLTSTQVSNHYQAAGFPLETTGARVGRVLNTLSWSSGARNIDAGATNVQRQTSTLTTTSSLSHIQDCELTENGACFMDPTGKVRFCSAATLSSSSVYTTSQATFGDEPWNGEIVYQPAPKLGLDDVDIYNEATAQRAGGVRQITSDSTSVKQYGRRTWQPNGSFLGTNDTDVAARLAAVIARYKQPKTRLQLITVDMLDAVGDGHLSAVQALDLLYIVTVNRHAQGFSQTSQIEHIDEKATASTYTITFGLDPTG